MAADGTPGARLQPQFLGTGAPATAEDLNILGNHIAKMGNIMALSTADREAFEADGWEGLFCYDTDESTLYLHDGSAWVVHWHDWKSYTPTTTNVSGGTITGKYTRLGKLVFGSVRHVLAGANYTGQPSFSLPVNAAFPGTEFLIAGAVGDDANGAEHPLIIRLTGAATFSPYRMAVVSSRVLYANISATEPFTWASTDVFKATFAYEAA